MAIERGEVEMLAHVAATEGASCRVTPDLLAELCRSYLAVLDAPVARPLELQCAGLDDPHRSALTRLVKSGVRVRLVPADGGSASG